MILLQLRGRVSVVFCFKFSYGCMIMIMMMIMTMGALPLILFISKNNFHKKIVVIMTRSGPTKLGKSEGKTCHVIHFPHQYSYKFLLIFHVNSGCPWIIMTMSGDASKNC